MFQFDENTRISGIIDNYNRGNVGDFLREKIQSGSTLQIVSALFTIYAYKALKEQLDQIGRLQFLLGEPKFVNGIDPNKIDKKAYKDEDQELQLARQLQQSRAARECAKSIEMKAERANSSLCPDRFNWLRILSILIQKTKGTKHVSAPCSG